MLLASKGHLKLTEITAEPTKSSRVEGFFLNVGLLGNSRHNTCIQIYLKELLINSEVRQQHTRGVGVSGEQQGDGGPPLC